MNQTKSGKKSASVSSNRRGSKSSNASSKNETTEITTVTTSEKIETSVTTTVNGDITESKEFVSQEAVVVIENVNSTEELTKLDKRETENVVTKQNDENNVNNIQNDGEKMEPLVYESDETESELEKLSAESSDVDSDKCKQNSGSPVLSRSTTRRSDFRNIPTPKTPKAIVIPINGSNEEVEIQDKTEDGENDIKLTQQITVVIEKMDNREKAEESEILCVESDENSTPIENGEPEIQIIDTNGYTKDDIEIESSSGSVSEELQNLKDTSSIKSTPDISISSLENISNAANYSGNNTTQNIEFTIQEEPTSNDDTSTNSGSQFIDQTRDLSYIKTLKVISGRKTLKDLRQTSFQNMQKKLQDSLSPRIGKVQGQRRDLNSLKRKGDSSYISDVQMEYSKRMRVEDGNSGNDSGILSYVSSPISMLKMKFAKSSTPIRPGSLDYENNRYSEEINVEPVNNTTDKANSWCSVQ